jgi:hypothetical protein
MSLASIKIVLEERMSRLNKLTWLWMIFIILELAACSGGAPTTDPGLALTQIWQTVEVAQAQTALAESLTPTITDTPSISATPKSTNTPLLTNTPLPGTPSVTPLASSTPAGTQSAVCDNALGIKDVTYPDYSEVPAGESFIKIWQVKNLGPCTWNQDYHLIFGWGGTGTDWNTTPGSAFTAIVLPGESIEISVTLKAPTTAGTYGASFRLQNDKGFNFGPTQTVIIVVK